VREGVAGPAVVAELGPVGRRGGLTARGYGMALPVEERTGLVLCLLPAGLMHRLRHDLQHAAVGLGVARLLAPFAGELKAPGCGCLFQPAEENRPQDRLDAGRLAP